MLFDLRGRRQNAIKAIYLVLAILMGGGLVFFGIGGDVSGGLLNAFGGGGGGDSAQSAIEDRIEDAEKRLSANPQSAAALKALVRDNYQLATAQIPAGGAGFPEESLDDLQRASTYWERYLDTEQAAPDVSLASLAAQLYGPDALNRPPDAQEAYRIIAEERNDVDSYLLLISAATTAGDKRTADLATIKAVDLAPKARRKELEKQIRQIKNDAKQQAAGASAGG